MKRLALVLLLLLPLGCAPADQQTPASGDSSPSAPADSNATTAAPVQEDSSVADVATTTTEVVIAVPGMS